MDRVRVSVMERGLCLCYFSYGCPGTVAVAFGVWTSGKSMGGYTGQSLSVLPGPH